MVSFSRVASVAAVALLALPAAQAQGPAPRCQDLDATPYQNVASSRVSLLDLLERAAAPAGWSVRSDGFGAWRGPMLRDDEPFRSTKEAVSRFIRDTADAGWQVGGTIDAPNCVIRVSYHGVIPKNESLSESALPSSSASERSPADVAYQGGPSKEQKAGETGGDVLLSGDALSSRLGEWLRAQGWGLSWALDYDYFLEKDLPLMGDTIDAKIEFILRVYQSQGGLTNARARIAHVNRVVVFEGVDYAAR
jgi:hypothetical protein